MARSLSGRALLQAGSVLPDGFSKATRRRGAHTRPPFRRRKPHYKTRTAVAEMPANAANMPRLSRLPAVVRLRHGVPCCLSRRSRHKGTRARAFDFTASSHKTRLTSIDDNQFPSRREDGSSLVSRQFYPALWTRGHGIRPCMGSWRQVWLRGQGLRFAESPCDATRAEMCMPKNLARILARTSTRPAATAMLRTRPSRLRRSM